MRRPIAQAVPGHRHAHGDSHHGGGAKSDEHHARVESDGGAQRQLLGTERAEQPDSCSADDEPERAAEHRQHGRFDHHLRDDVPASRANRLPYGALLLTRAGPDQQQVDQVHQPDEQQDQRARLHSSRTIDRTAAT